MLGDSKESEPEGAEVREVIKSNDSGSCGLLEDSGEPRKKLSIPTNGRQTQWVMLHMGSISLGNLCLKKKKFILSLFFHIVIY